MNQASSGINFASLEGDPELIGAQPEKMIVDKAKGNERKKANFLLMGVRSGGLF